MLAIAAEFRDASGVLAVLAAVLAKGTALGHMTVASGVRAFVVHGCASLDRNDWGPKSPLYAHFGPIGPTGPTGLQDRFEGLPLGEDHGHRKHDHRHGSGPGHDIEQAG